MKEAEELLNFGLEAGYAGVNDRDAKPRGELQVEQSELQEGDGYYIDQWIADRVGGGQEIARQYDEGTVTRLYAGGTISLEKLEELGLTKKDVTSQLKKFIQWSERKTRLREDYESEPDGDWGYSYKVILTLDQIPLRIGVETIVYQDQLVFAHGILLTTVE